MDSYQDEKGKYYLTHTSRQGRYIEAKIYDACLNDTLLRLMSSALKKSELEKIVYSSLDNSHIGPKKSAIKEMSEKITDILLSYSGTSLSKINFLHNFESALKKEKMRHYKNVK